MGVSVSTVLVAACGELVPNPATSAPTITTTPAAATTTTPGFESLCERIASKLDDLPLPPDLEAVFDPVVADGMAAMDAVGLTLAVQCAESPLYVKGYGTADLASAVPAAADTVYEIGSISKQFVSVEILRFEQEGKLSLADPAGSYLPWLPQAWRQISLEQLLSHTGGVPDHFAIFREDPETPFDWGRDYTAAELVAAFVVLDGGLVAAPGTTFSYSNTGYIILTAIIEQLTGQTLATVLDRSLFGPLGLERTAFCSPTLPGLAVGYTSGPAGPAPGPEVPPSFFSGAAGLCSTAGDLIRWERSLVDGAAAGPDGFRAMSTPATLDDGTQVPYGLGLVLDRLGRDDAIFHEGGTASFSSWLAYFPRSDLMVAILSNSLGPHSIALKDLVLDLTQAASGR